MISKKITSQIEKFLDDKIIDSSSVHGGCINQTLNLNFNSGNCYFLKTNSGHASDMFRKEANGLKELATAKAIRVPKVVMVDDDFLLLESISSGRQKSDFFQDFGSSFAKMHKTRGANFGFHEDNYLGTTVQKNSPTKESWSEFFFENRLLFQLNLLEHKNLATSELRDGIKFLESNIEKILNGSDEPPSLLHGDLWGGNYLVDEEGYPCIIDPAVYYGHREADLAMTKLFGGFNQEFYQAYDDEFPLADGYQYRENIYKLYHILNHLNLFGRSYYSQVMSLINSYS